MKSVWNKMRQWFTVGDRRVWLHYGILALVILLPLLLPGYVFALDMVFTPHIEWPSDITNTYPLDILLWLLGVLLPGDVVQKLVLLAILLFSGAGMHLLVKELSPQKPAFSWRIAAYFAGLFYMVNPFIYSRLMAGQWLVLLGYALLPFLMWALVRLLAQATWRRTAAVAFFAWAVMTVSVHFVGVVAILWVLFLVAVTIKYWSQRAKIVRFAWQIVVAGILVCAASSYWLLPSLFGQNAIGEIAVRAGEAEFSAFATYSGPLGTVGEVLRLQGFWPEIRDLFVLPQNVMPLWGVLILLLWILVMVGAVQAWKSNRAVAVIMVGCIIMGVILAASPLIQTLSYAFPILGGWREPHKFTVLVVLGYGVLGAFGVAWLVKRKRRSKMWAVFCLALPILITPTMFWAAGGQLQSRDYPREWYALNTQLKQVVGQNEKVLFLPWHMYAPYSFSGGRLIANPAEKFFEVSVVVSDNPEFDGIAPNRADPTKERIAALLKNPHDMKAVLAELNVRYVVLAKEQQWQQEYSFLETLERTYEDEKIILYKVGQ